MKNQQLIPILLPTEDASILYFNAVSQLSHQTNISETRPLLKRNQHIYLRSALPKIPTKWYYDEFVKDIRNTSGAQYEFAKHIFPIIATTNPKLIANGVLPINGNTEIFVELSKDAQVEGMSKQIKVNFLSEFCNRYNQKGNQKVDVEKLAEMYIRNGKDFKAEGLSEYQNGKMNGFADGYNQALKSNANKKWTDEDMMTWYKYVKTHTCEEAFKHLQSLTKEQSKGDIVIECEVEICNGELRFDGGGLVGRFYKCSKCNDGSEYGIAKLKCKQSIIKLDSSGQPILIFK